MKPFTRILSICLGTCLIILLIGLISARVYLATPHFRNLVLFKINPRIAGHVRIDGHRLSLLKGKIVLSRGSLTGQAGDPVIEFKQLGVNVKWSALLNREIELSSIVLTEPQIILQMTPAGELTVQQAVRSGDPDKTVEDQTEATTSLPIAIKIGELRIESGSLVYADSATSLRTSVDDINAVGALDLAAQEASLTLETGTIHVNTKAVDTQLDGTRLIAAYQDSRLNVSDLQARFKTSLVQASGVVANVLADPKINLELRADSSLADLKTLTGLTPVMTGRLDLQVKATGTLNNPQANLSLTYGGGHLGAYTLDGAVLTADLADRYLTIRNVHIDSQAGRLSGSGSVDAQAALPGSVLPFQFQSDLLAYDFSLGGTGIDVSKLTSGPNILTGEADGRIHLAGRGIDPRKLAATLAAEIAVPNLSAESVTAPVDVVISCASHVDQGKAVIDLLTIGSAQLAANLKTTGTLDLADRSLSGTFDLHAPSLSGIFELAGITGLQGALTLNGDVSGSIDQPRINLTLQGDQLAYGTVRAGTLGGVARLDQDGWLYVSQLDLNHQEAKILGRGRIQLFDPDSIEIVADPDFELAVTGRNIRTSDYTDQVRATIDLQAQAKGKVSDPSGTLVMRAENVAVAGQSFESIELDAVVGDLKIRLAPLRIRGPARDEITAQGWVALDRSFELAIRSERWALAQIGLLEDVGEVGGVLRFSFRGSGSLKAPVIDGDVQISDVTLNRQPFKDTSIHVALRDQQIQLQATQAFELEASHDLGSGDFTVAAVFDQTQLKPYFALTGRADFAGLLSGAVNAHGNANRFKQATALVDLTQLDLFYGAEKLVSTQNFKAELKDNRFTLPESTWSILEQGHLKILGQGAFDGLVNLSIEGSVPLRAANPFLAAIDDLNGQINVQATVAGETVNPSIDAQIELQDIGVTLPVVLQRLHGLNGRIQVVDSKVTFEDVAGQVGKGRFDVSGTVGLAKWQSASVDLMLNAHKLPIEIPETMSLELNSRLSFKGDRDRAIAEGEIVVLDGLYYKDIKFNPLSGFTTIKREAPARTARPEIPFLGHTALDISVKRRRPFVVDINMAYLEISPDLRLQGTVNNPVLSGRARVDTGDIYYAGKTFVVKRGIVDFLNPYKIEPTLDIRSDVVVRDWLITLLISGTPADLKVELSSDPPEQNADILSLLVAGKTSAEMRGGSSGASMSANQMMAQLVASTFGDDIKQATGIDFLEVSTTDDQADGESNLVKVTIGKKLTERMTVKYAVSSNQGETIRSTISEYQLMDTFLVSGFQDTKGVYGGELVFRIEFR